MGYNELDDWQQFRSLDTLPSKAGVSRDKLSMLVAKELADNALDSGSKCNVGELPDGFFVKDDGPGIEGTDEDIASLFSMRRPLRTTKMWRLPTRGALGNGLRVVAGLVCATNGDLVVSTRGRKLRLLPQYNDGHTKYEHLGPVRVKGTMVEVTLPGMSDNSLVWAKRALLMSEGKDYDGNASPWWYCSESFRTLVNSSPHDLSLMEFIKKFGVEDKKSRKLSFAFSSKNLNHSRKRIVIIYYPIFVN